MENNKVNSDKDINSLPSLSSMQRLAISESGFVFDPVTGHNFTVNETGMAILRLLQKDNDVRHLLSSLEEEYDVNSRELERDTMDFVGALKDYVGE